MEDYKTQWLLELHHFNKMDRTEGHHIKWNKLDSKFYCVFNPVKQRIKRSLETRSLIGREGD